MKSFTIEICESTRDRELIVYGTGAVGEVVRHALAVWGREPDLYCDHDPQKNRFFDKDVIPAEQLGYHRDAVVLAAFKDFLPSAVRVLREADVGEYYSVEDLIEVPVDAETLSKGAREFLVRNGHYGRLVSLAEQPDTLTFNHLEWMLTERCSLRCADCSALIPYFDHPRDHNCVQTCAALERLLCAVDYISELSVLGGEPLLYPELTESLGRFAHNDKIGAVVVYTNGTVLPDDKLLEVLKNMNGWVHISDYGQHSPLLSELETLLSEAGLRFFTKRYDTWQAVGLPEYRDESTEQLTLKYRRCFKARCYSLFEDRLYGCARASNGAAAGLIPDKEYVDLSAQGTVEDDRKAVRELMSLPFLDACRRCGGMVAGVNNISPAVQAIKKGKA